VEGELSLSVPSLGVAIPTYRRGQVLIDTIEFLVSLPAAPREILILDQTESHDAATQAALSKFVSAGLVKWMRLPFPSITCAMNAGLRASTCDLLLFLDDDIRPDPELVSSHLRAHASHPGWIVAGRVLQPWHAGRFDQGERDFRFNSELSREVPDFMGGNFSVDRLAALKVGGFDENFVRVAYRFEAEFALRWRRAGGRIWYESSAVIHHLKESTGGTREFGDYLRTAVPAHSVGEYYFSIASRPPGWWRTLFVRPLRAVMTRHHLRRPWWIPVTLVAEFGGIVWALLLTLRGPRLLKEAKLERESAASGG
jgi:GT2 family glycosyltransferase